MRSASPMTLFSSVREFLVNDEATHNLMLGLLESEARASRPGDLVYLGAVADQQGQIQGAALGTAGRPLILSKIESEEAVNYLVQDVFSINPGLVGVVGPVRPAAEFARIWTSLSGDAVSLEVSERIYQLTDVLPGSSGPEQMRQAVPKDYSWLLSWMLDFTVEAMGEVTDPHNFAHRSVTIRLAGEWRSAGFMVLEESGNPCCIVGYSGPTPHGIRIAPVYTPLHYRGRGYATDLVRRVSQQLLDWGYQQVFLFTDLANPTSNHIYPQVGYQPVSDIDQYHFQRRLL